MTAEEYRESIKKLHLSQVGAAKFLGVHQRTSRRWALGEAEIPKAVELVLSLMVKQNLSIQAVAEMLKTRRNQTKSK